jgi:hypothetical protein
MDTSLESVKLDNDSTPVNTLFQNDITDSQTHATPLKRMVAACSGALLTSLFSKN